MSRGTINAEPRGRRLRYASWNPQAVPENYYDYDYPEPEPPARPARAQSGAQGGASSAVPLLVILVLLLAGWIAWKSYREGFPTGSTGPGGVPYSTAADSNVHWVNADNVNLRAQPEARARVLYLLPRNTRVVLLGEYQTEPNGDTWAKVRVQVGNGYAQDGWIIYRYIN